MNNDTTPPTATPLQQPASEAAKKKKVGLAIVIVALLVIVAAAITYFINPGILTGESEEDPIVTITNSGFNPETIKIKKGQSVSWINEDTTPHQVASDPYPSHSILPHLFAEQPLAQNESFTYSFEEKGTFTYHDNLKPVDFKGTVIVE